MANLIALATGNFSAAGSWGVADTTMVSLAGTTATTVPTSGGASSDSAGFTPGIITVDGILLNLAARVGTTGTMTVTLRNATAGSDVTSVTINTADLPAMGTSAVSPGSWLFFKFGSSQILLAATSYKVRCVTSSATQVQLYAGASNAWNLALRTTTTAAPGAADRLFIQKELTGAGTANAITVTMDNNDTTSFGKIDVTQSTFAWSITGNTRLRTAGNLDIWESGVVTLGTVLNPVPVGTTAILDIDCSSNAQFGIQPRTGSTFTLQGGNKTYWKSLLAADAAASATSLTLADSVGSNWKNGDSIALASTTRTASQSEKKALSADGSGTTLTIAAIANDHSGTAPTQAEVLNLTRNVIVQGPNSSAYISILSTSLNVTCDWDWAEFTNLGSATSNKEGISWVASSGTFTVNKCSLHDSTVASSIGILITGSLDFVIQDNVFYNIALNHISINSALAATGWVIDGNIGILNASASNIFVLSDIGGTFTNNTAVSGSSSGAMGLSLNEANATIGTFSGFTAHANNGPGLSVASPFSGTFSTITVWRNNTFGITTSAIFNSAVVSTFQTITAFGNTTSNINIGAGCMPMVFDGITSNAGVTLTCPIGFSLSSGSGNVPVGINSKIINSTFGATTTHSTADIQGATSSSFYQLYLKNCALNSTTDVSLTSSSPTPNASFVRSARHGQVAGAYKSWFRYGIIENDNTTFNTAAPSQKMTPNSATVKLTSAIKSVALASGQTATVGVYTRKAAAGANPPRLMVKRNDAAGITADTALDTMTAGINTWEALSGTTAAVTENCVLEFFVDSDSGNTTVWCDDWTVTLV